mmetsp:Transcript_21708/g.38702  ORF Transcript_21708/g.38702 Transcript_21708/m.38702 type:complete len:254 (+) Transcript_21708:345-1106(+)
MLLRVCLERVDNDLGRHVLHCAQPRDGALLVAVYRQPKVADLDHHVVGEQQILRLQVAVEDAPLVEVVEGVQQRQHHNLQRFTFRQFPPPPSQLLKQITPGGQLLHQHEKVVALKAAVEVDDVGVLDAAVDVHLAPHLKVVERVHCRLFVHLHHHTHPTHVADGLEHIGGGPLVYALFEGVVGYRPNVASHSGRARYGVPPLVGQSLAGTTKHRWLGGFQRAAARRSGVCATLRRGIATIAIRSGVFILFLLS